MLTQITAKRDLCKLGSNTRIIAHVHVYGIEGLTIHVHVTVDAHSSLIDCTLELNTRV